MPKAMADCCMHSCMHQHASCGNARDVACTIATSCRDWTLQDGDQLFVSGNLPQLGSWQQDQPLLLSEVQTPFWEAEVGRRAFRRCQVALAACMCRR